jgi:hypothetical protein
MKLFGSLKELVSVVFRKDGKEVTLEVGTQAGTATSRVFTLPDINSNSPVAHELLTENSVQDVTNKTIDADLNTITNIENADIKAGAAIDATKIGSGTVSNTEFGYLDGVSSAIQTQLNGKAASGANSDITSLSGLTTALSIGQGGTGQTTANAALNALLPSQSTNSGKALLTDGSNATWQTIPANGGTFLAADGLVGSPGISFNLDSDTGLYRTGTGGVGFSSNATKAGEYNNSGSWILGISQASNGGKHLFYGTQGTIANQNYVLELRANDTSTSDVVIRYGLDRVNGQGFQDVAIAGVGGGGYRFAANTTDVGGHTSGGAWTLGPSAGTVSQAHEIRSENNNVGCLKITQRSTTSGQSYGLDISAGTNSSDASQRWYNAAGSALLGTVKGDGAWTLGSSSGSAIHLVQGGANSGAGIGAPLNLLNTTGGVAWRVGPTNNNGFVVLNSSDVGLYITNGATSWTGTSDIRVKKNVVDSEFGLQEVMSLRPVKFDYTMDSSEESARVGFIAQEVHAVLPHAAYKPKNEEEMMGVSPTEMIPVLVKAVQELKQQLDEAKAKIAVLESK